MADVASMESTGLAWVSFPDPQEAAAASTKHTHMMEQRYIEILPATSTGVGHLLCVAVMFAKACSKI